MNEDILKEFKKLGIENNQFEPNEEVRESYEYPTAIYSYEECSILKETSLYYTGKTIKK